MKALILASSSTYRKVLLARLGLIFETVSPEVDETPERGEAPSDLVRRLARLKAHTGSTGRAGALIIGSDQCAALGLQILGKPGAFERAFQQLKRVSGRSVVFHTGLCLLDTASGDEQVDVATVSVKFRPFTDAQIAAYLRKEAPYQCAGSFMSEGLGIALVERLESDDPTALIGLPLIRLTSMLARAGVRVV